MPTASRVPPEELPDSDDELGVTELSRGHSRQTPTPAPRRSTPSTTRLPKSTTHIDSTPEPDVFRLTLELPSMSNFVKMRAPAPKEILNLYSAAAPGQSTKHLFPAYLRLVAQKWEELQPAAPPSSMAPGNDGRMRTMAEIGLSNNLTQDELRTGRHGLQAQVLHVIFGAFGIPLPAGPQVM